MSSPPDDARIIHSNGQSLRVIFSLLAVILVVSILLVDSFLHRQRDTQMCEMSYSRPVFVPLAPGPTSRIRDKYTLYLYRERIIDNMHEVHIHSNRKIRATFVIYDVTVRRHTSAFHPWACRQLQASEINCGRGGILSSKPSSICTFQFLHW